MKTEIDWRGGKEEKQSYWKVQEERKQLVRSQATQSGRFLK
jgi:hypothetical protein